ncbi:hypothetical protein NVP1178O_27 [Vibrio phage 1.178.O._10N.286.45.E12]|nr:hypothetical protein NVP1178O_27 [Vibrio phage 1.178.O._10N.286.45.E12]
MISFDQKSNPKIHDIMTREVELRFDGESHNIIIHSMSSRRAVKEAINFQRRHKYALEMEAKGEGILYEKGQIDAGLGVMVDGMVETEWSRKHSALLAMAVVEGYPESRDLEADLIENTALCAFIIEEASELQSEYIKKKET